ncbi:MAG: effector binding domain-containing protein [Cyanobacteriota bacterium]
MVFVRNFLSFLIVFAFILLPTAIGQVVSTTPKVVDKGSITVVGVSKNYGMSTKSKPLFDQWTSFLNQATSISNQNKKNEYLGISIPKSWTKFDYITGVSVSSAGSIPAGLTSTVVPAQKYALFTFKGSLNAYEKETDNMLGKYLKESKLKWNQEAPLIEVFKSGAFTPENMQSSTNEIDLYVPLKN